MKKNLFKSVLTGLALLAGTVASAQTPLADNVKFYLGVTGWNQQGTPATVSATVYDDYKFEVQMPELVNGVCQVGVGQAKVDIALQNTSTLGVGGTIRQHSAIINTTVDGIYANLGEMLSSAYHFQSTTVPVSVIDGSKTSNFVYDIQANSNSNMIVGTATSPADASKAWKIITDNVTSTTKTFNDSYYVAKAGTYLQIGDERYEFKEDVDLMKGEFDLGDIVDQMLDHSKAKLVKNVATGADTYKAVVYLPAGSTLSVSNSMAVLNKSVTITFDMTSLYQQQDLTGILSQILASVNSSADANVKKYKTILTSVSFFNQLIAMIDAAETVPVEVLFTPAEETTSLDAYINTDLGIEVQFDIAPAAFETILAEYPNAVAKLVSGPVPAVKNVIYCENNQFYCDNFVLTDPLPQYSTVQTAAYANFYTPVNFIAKQGSYVRPLYNGYNSICVPFAISTEMTGINDILTYESYDGDVTVTFTSGATNAAGVPAVIISDGTALDVAFNNTEVVAAPVNGNSTYGTFALTNAYAHNYFGVNTDTNKFEPLIGILAPFRSCLNLNNVPSNNGAKGISIKVVEAPATGINSVNASESNAIYTVSGVKMNKIAQPGLYIVNGKKVSVK